MATKQVPKPTEECVEETKASKVKVEENGRSAIFFNIGKSKIRRIRIDGCLICEGVRCDWIVSHEKCVDVLVELKGTDVDHAVQQLEQTLRLWLRNPNRGISGRTAALIVCSQYPRIDTTIQRAKLRFAKEFKTPLHIKSYNLEYKFCELSKYA